MISDLGEGYTRIHKDKKFLQKGMWYENENKIKWYLPLKLTCSECVLKDEENIDELAVIKQVYEFGFVFSILLYGVEAWILV